MSYEVRLDGGRWTDGIVRVGDTVRRPSSPASAFTARLLNSLADQGFDGCPRYLGQDYLGRDILTFLPGETAHWQRFDDRAIAAAGRLLRGFHDATRPLASQLGSAVVCHHDPAPNNAIFRDGVPVALIDFDFAEPGDPLEDVGYAAWSWCISSKPERGPAIEQARQIRVLTDAYGLGANVPVVDAVVDQLERNVVFWQRASRPRADEMIAWTRQELAYVTREFLC